MPRRPSPRRPGGPASKAPSHQFAKAVRKQAPPAASPAPTSASAPPTAKPDAPTRRPRTGSKNSNASNASSSNAGSPRSGSQGETSTPTGHDCFAIAAPGMAPLVAAELQQLGVLRTDVEPAGVAFRASVETLVRLNCWSRLATRFVMRLDAFEARDFATLEKRALRVPWRTVLAPDTTAEIVVTCRKSRLYHSDAVAERVARGIQASVPGVLVKTALAERHDQEDDTDDTDDTAKSDDSENASNAAVAASTGARVQRILVRLDRDVCTISADSSGELLHRRGWRLDSGKAPLRETLAAALLVASGWTPDLPLVDPMCGAGTIAIEAALRARRIAPGLSRTFACEAWPGVDPDIARRVREAARAVVLPQALAPIIAADRDAGAMEATRTNAERAGVLQDLTMLHQPLSTLDLRAVGERGWLVTNPPYGIRTGKPETLRALWGRLGATLRQGGPGWTLGVVVPDQALAREVRVPLERVVATATGGRPVAFARSRLPAAPDASDSPDA